MTAQEEADRIYTSMGGFRIKNTHKKKCAKTAVQLLLCNLDADSPKYEFYAQVFSCLDKMKTAKD